MNQTKRKFMRTNLIEITIPSLMLYVAVEIPTFQPSAFAWKWIMIINNKLSISRFTPTLFKKMWKSHRSLWLLWFTMPCDPSYACFTLVYVKRNLTEYMDRSSSINLPFDRRPATYLIHGKLWVVVTRFLSLQMYFARC